MSYVSHKLIWEYLESDESLCRYVLKMEAEWVCCLGEGVSSSWLNSQISTVALPFEFRRELRLIFRPMGDPRGPQNRRLRPHSEQTNHQFMVNLVYVQFRTYGWEHYVCLNFDGCCWTSINLLGTFSSCISVNHVSITNGS